MSDTENITPEQPEEQAEPITPMTGEQAMNAVEAMKAQMDEEYDSNPPLDPAHVLRYTVKALRQLDKPFHADDLEAASKTILTRLASMEAMKSAIEAWSRWLEARAVGRAEVELIDAAVAQKKAVAAVTGKAGD